MRVKTSFLLLLYLLAWAGCGKEKSTDELIGDLKSSPQQVERVKAVRQMPQEQEDAAQVVPALIEVLKDKNVTVRRGAAIKLGSLGEQAKEAIPALQAALRDRDAK
jgi:HEAT repeat protein